MESICLEIGISSIFPVVCKTHMSTNYTRDIDLSEIQEYVAMEDSPIVSFQEISTRDHFDRLLEETLSSNVKMDTSLSMLSNTIDTMGSLSLVK